MATQQTKDRQERNRRRRMAPVRSYAAWDNLGDVNAALMMLENGDFSQASRMCDGFWRDDRFHGVMRTRMLAQKTVPLDLLPADDRPKAAELAEMLGAKEKGPTEWDRMYSPANIGELVKWGNMVGLGVAEQLWETDDGSFIPMDADVGYQPPKKASLWKPRLRIWHPQFVRWDETQQRYILRTLDGDVLLPDVEQDRHSDGHWIVWCPFGYQQAWQKGIVIGLGRLLLDRGWTGTDWGHYNEVYGRPIKLVVTPSTPNDEVDGDLFDSVAAVRGDTTIQLRQSADPERNGGYDVKLLEAKSRGWDTFDAKKNHTDKDIAILVLGQELTTSVGASGSRALGDVQNMVRRDYLKADCDVSQCLFDQGLYHYAAFNYRDPTLAPIPVYRLDPPEDMGKKSAAQLATAQMIATAKAAGAPVDDRAAMEAAEIPLLSEEEQAAREAVAAEEKAAADEAAAAQLEQAGGGQGGGQGDQGGGEGDPAKMTGAPGRVLALAAKKQDPNVVNRYHFAGLNIAVENPKGSVRKWAGGETRMQHDYGYIEGHTGNDAEGVDCYIGPNPQAKSVYVVHQLRAPTYDRYDEDKVMLGFDSHEAAVKAYVAHRNDGDKAIKSVSTHPLDHFHRALDRRTGTGAIRASARIDSVRALMRLADLSGAAVLALRGAPPRDTDKRLRWADSAVKNGTRAAARALAVDLAAIKDEIGKATSFPDLEKRVLARFKGMDPSRLAGIVQKVRVMGNLAGQASVVKEAQVKKAKAAPRR